MLRAAKHRRAGATLVGAVCALALAVFLSPPALAQAYPAKPVHLVVGYPPGGASDIIARMLAIKLQESLSQSVVVENRAGANGNIGADYVAKAPADGYIMGFGGGGPLTANAHLYKNLPYNPAKDFAMVGTVGRAALVLAANPSMGARTLREFLDMAKASPGKLAFGTPGNGSPQHLATAMLMSVTGTQLVHVPYKGATPMLNDLVGGRIHVGFDNLGMRAHVASGRLLALGVAQDKRAASYPDVPTFAEAGVPGVQAFTWYGVFAPAGTPAQVVARMNGALRQVLQDADVQKRLADLGVEVMAGSPAEMQSFVDAEILKWGKYVRELGLRLD
jgi:tripartite-type tricarboxylate transporter receptor subunit TctC